MGNFQQLPNNAKLRVESRQVNNKNESKERNKKGGNSSESLSSSTYFSALKATLFGILSVTAHKSFLVSKSSSHKRGKKGKSLRENYQKTFVCYRHDRCL